MVTDKDLELKFYSGKLSGIMTTMTLIAEAVDAETYKLMQKEIAQLFEETKHAKRNLMI